RPRSLTRAALAIIARTSTPPAALVGSQSLRRPVARSCPSDGATHPPAPGQTQSSGFAPQASPSLRPLLQHIQKALEVLRIPLRPHAAPCGIDDLLARP